MGPISFKSDFLGLQSAGVLASNTPRPANIIQPAAIFVAPRNPDANGSEIRMMQNVLRIVVSSPDELSSRLAILEKLSQLGLTENEIRVAKQTYTSDNTIDENYSDNWDRIKMASHVKDVASTISDESTKSSRDELVSKLYRLLVNALINSNIKTRDNVATAQDALSGKPENADTETVHQAEKLGPAVSSYSKAFEIHDRAAQLDTIITDSSKSLQERQQALTEKAALVETAAQNDKEIASNGRVDGVKATIAQDTKDLVQKAQEMAVSLAKEAHGATEAAAITEGKTPTVETTQISETERQLLEIKKSMDKIMDEMMDSAIRNIPKALDPRLAVRSYSI